MEAEAADFCGFPIRQSGPGPVCHWTQTQPEKILPLWSFSKKKYPVNKPFRNFLFRHSGWRVKFCRFFVFHLKQKKSLHKWDASIAEDHGLMWWLPLFLQQNHYGGLDGGHYTAYCKSVLKQRWYKFDDHEVSDISTSSVKSSAAYILFYSTLWWGRWTGRGKHFTWATILRERLFNLTLNKINLRTGQAQLQGDWSCMGQVDASPLWRR